MPASPLRDERLELVILGDWGRDGGIRFCAEVARREHEALASLLPAGESFFDEYRRIAMTLAGDVHFAKAPWLEAGAWLDESVLVGYPGGLTIEQVVPRLLQLALGAMAGPVARGARAIVLALPCNTLAPASWALAELLSSSDSVAAALEGAELSVDDAAAVTVRALGDGLRVDVPTVPESVAAGLGAEVESLLAIGTTQIPALYREAVSRRGSRVSVVEPTPDWQRAALDAINAALAGDREAARDALTRIAREARAEHGESLALVEACTDLDFGVGLDSNGAYAAAIVAMAYPG